MQICAVFKYTSCQQKAPIKSVIITTHCSVSLCIFSYCSKLLSTKKIKIKRRKVISLIISIQAFFSHQHMHTNNLTYVHTYRQTDTQFRFLLVVCLCQCPPKQPHKTMAKDKPHTLLSSLSHTQLVSLRDGWTMDE